MAEQHVSDEVISNSGVEDDGQCDSPDNITCIRIVPSQSSLVISSSDDNMKDFATSSCSKEVMEKVSNNYVIIKNILSYLTWQEKKVCKNVSNLWDSIIETLSKEQLNPVDLSINLTLRARRKGYKLKKSGILHVEPMVLIIFGNTPAINEFPCGKCEAVIPSPCHPPCEKEHSILDMIFQTFCSEKDPMFVTKSLYISYLPLQNTPSYDNAITRLLRANDAYYTGLCIPAMPDVEFKVINMKTSRELPDIVNQLKAISESHIIKGALVFLTDNYTLYVDQDESVVVNCLHHLSSLQPDTPFALGGCLVEDAMCSSDDIDGLIDSMNAGREHVSGNQMSLGLFVVRKDAEIPPTFDMFSVVLESTEWSKEKIHTAIREFQQRIPTFEHSVGFKLSCSGRQQKHEVEQSAFRAAFPRTRLLGCLGNGELGVDRPAPRAPHAKRPRVVMQYDKVHSYSTVFVLAGWGRVLAPPQC